MDKFYQQFKSREVKPQLQDFKVVSVSENEISAVVIQENKKHQGNRHT